MWRMKMVLCKQFLLLSTKFILIGLPCWSQKKWDGGGGDSLWSNPFNWFPDGVPAANDLVYLDNEWVAFDYVVTMPSGLTTTTIHSLHLKPGASKQITLTLPITNTASPGLNLTSTDTALFIGNGGVLINASGAPAGNAIVLTGKMKIENGGKYSHQTTRGNTLLVSSLVITPENRYGIFEFNVPGNSAYTVSASGRHFGTLVFSGQTSSRKTYTSSGSNKLNIAGDLIINQQAGFTSSLTNNICIDGNLNIKGRLYINPVSQDTSGRCMEMNGIHQEIEVTGLFNQGLHFRKWLINGKQTVLKSNIHIEQASGTIQINSGVFLDLGGNRIHGIGSFTAETNTSFACSGRYIISDDSLSNISTQHINIHPNIRFICYGESPQTTGSQFPLTIKTLILNKPNTKLTLTQSLTINDTLLLNKGIITLPDTSSIGIRNYCSSGNDSSYIEGQIKQSNNQLQLNFPLGIDNKFLPAIISRTSNTATTYAMQIKRLESDTALRHMIAPIEKIMSPYYWVLSKDNTNQHEVVEEKLELISKFDDSSNSINCIAKIDSIDSHWRLASNPNFLTAQTKISTNIKPLVSGSYTLAKAQHAILPLATIYLEKQSTKEGIYLKWKVNDDENAEYYCIERSVNGNLFSSTDSLISLKNKGKTWYSKRLETPVTEGLFLRIRGIDQDWNSHYSNIIFVRTGYSVDILFPNPSKNNLYLKTQERIMQMHFVLQNGKTIGADFEKNGNLFHIRINHLAIGNYFLIVQFADRRKIFQFTKQ